MFFKNKAELKFNFYVSEETMSKKLFGILAVAGLILVLALSACGGSTPTPTPVVEEVDPSDANDEPFDFYEGETRNISPFVFRVFESKGGKYMEVCRIGLFEKFKYTGPVGGNELYIVLTQSGCFGWVDFSWGKYLVE